MEGVGHLFVVILQTAVLCLPLALSMWALLDCARRPSWTWAMTTRSQQVWLYSILCGILVLPVGIAVSSFYLLRVRPEVAGVEEGRLPDFD